MNKSDLTADTEILREVLAEEDNDNPEFRAQWKGTMEAVFGIELPPKMQEANKATNVSSRGEDWFSLRSSSPEPILTREDELDYLDPSDGHLWRAMYSVLSGDALYFYRNKADAESSDAVYERQQTSSDRSFPETKYEKCVCLESVATVRSAEQEHGENTLELSGDEKLILRAHNRDEMNQWLFQFHLCIASFVMDIVDSVRGPVDNSFIHYSPIRPRVVTAASFSPQFQRTFTNRVSLSHGHGRHNSGRRIRGQQDILRHADEFLPFPLDGSRIVTPLLPRQSDDNSFPPEICSTPQTDTPETERPRPRAYVPPQRRERYVPRAARQQQMHELEADTGSDDFSVDAFHHWLGGCADPNYVVGSITDDQFIPRKASRLGKVRSEPFGYQDHRVDVGAFSECGIRETNEDSFFVTNHLERCFGEETQTEGETTSLFAIFDGHCGDHAARFAAEQLVSYMRQESLLVQPRDLRASLAGITEQAILNMDKAFCNFCVEGGRDWDSGSTALVASLFENELTVANLGDARCIIGRTVHSADDVAEHETDGWVELPQEDYSQGRCLWKEITDIHSPHRDDETERIKDANGWITTEKEIPVGQLKRMALDDDDVVDILQRCFADRYQPSPKASAPHRMLQISRVCGELAVSRSLGDRDFKADYNHTTMNEFGMPMWDPSHLFLCYPDEHDHVFVGDLVSNQPEFTSVSVGNADEEFLVFACDGLWDVLDPGTFL